MAQTQVLKMQFDLASQSLREINQALHDTENQNGETYTILHPKGTHSVAVGLTKPIEVNIDGHVGYYCAGMNKNASIHVLGNAGPGLAENMMSGRVFVDGNASQYAGASGHGGLLVIKGNTSSRCGISMKGIDIVVGGSIGHFGAFMAQTGRLVVCQDCGGNLGDSIYEAQIYVRGDIDSLGSDCVEKEMRPEHKSALQEVLERACVGFSETEFRRYGSARNLYNFKIDNANAI